MSLIPVDAVREATVPARLRIITPKVTPDVIPLRFNPTEYQLQKQNNFAEISIPGLETPPIQYVRGASEKLTLELIVDTSDTLEDVRKKYVDAVRGLLNINTELHAPPLVAFEWDREIFKGVLESLNVTYTLFSSTGVPLRAKLSTTLREYRPVNVQFSERPRNSPDVEKSFTVRRGDELWSIAAQIYRDPAQWRALALANDIQDPRSLEPGTQLLVPRLR
ncbi:nucleoid-associated protein YgaU [Bradyrhizobium sp. AZCC 1610]|uniref:CIS tube protein n=1 Tax=Bradyrhizobium sp. AZCC 1610 TaxID=3117020 RepID=UPI002FEF4420